MSRDIVNREDAAVAATVRARNEELARDSEHPSNDELLAYHERSLADEVAERIRDHVALCPECARRGLDLAVFVREDAAAEDDLPGDGTVNKSWDALRSTLREEGLVDRSEGSSPGWLARFFTGGPFGSLRFAYALASVFFLTTVSTSVWLVKEKRTVAELSRPSPFQPVELLPNRVRERLREQGLPVKLQATDKDLAFSLGSSGDDLPAEASLRARIFDLRRPDTSMWTVEPLSRDLDGYLSLKIPGRLVPPGKYEIRIYSLEDRVLAEFSFQIFEPQASGRLDRHEAAADP